MGGDETYFFFDGVFPLMLEPPNVAESIRKLSPAFVRIYSQALEAENRKLDEVCGSALRRALEFLVKDYLIKKGVADKKTIKATALGACINNFVSDSNVKTCAERATWLGNDATHYEQKYSTNDITHLKDLIGLTVYWIDSEIKTEKYRGDITKK